jgi:hypothetical protein
MPVRLSVRMEQTWLPPEGFYNVLYLSIFRSCVQKVQVLLKSDKNNGYFTRRHLFIYDSKGKGKVKVIPLQTRYGPEGG